MKTYEVFFDVRSNANVQSSDLYIRLLDTPFKSQIRKELKERQTKGEQGWCGTGTYLIKLWESINPGRINYKRKGELIEIREIHLTETTRVSDFI